MLMALVPSIAAVAANLLEISATRQTPHPNSGPPQLAHQLCQSPARASTAAALRDFQNIEEGLCGDALDSVVTDLTVQSLQGQPPGISIPCGKLGLRLLQLTEPRHEAF